MQIMGKGVDIKIQNFVRPYFWVLFGQTGGAGGGGGIVVSIDTVIGGILLYGVCRWT